uniref:ABC transporter domain-containing protein n=1 Tax=Leersia perrieri TaxID=77586 RepID=A0A0D9XCM5_9ORYZ
MPDGGGVREVNMRRLSSDEQRALLQRAAEVGDDHARFLSKFKERVDRVGIKLPTIEVRYENLNVEAESYVGSRGLPNIFNTYANIFEGMANALHITPKKKQKISILHNLSGIIKPHRSSWIRKNITANGLGWDTPIDYKGTITYNGHTMDEFVPQRSAAYVSQHDLHLAELTVRETVSFSAKCQGVGHHYDLLMELLRREKEANIKPDPEIDIYLKAATTGDQKAEVVTNHILKILGLDICADTIVGNNMLRGISGGQKKRLTTAEMLVTPGRALFMDEISTGLDSSTTFHIVNSIRHTIRILGGTAVIALLQPAPETYELFDDIILLSDGQVVYNGPRDHVLEFFKSVGFKCPERKGVADFLQEVTSRKDQKQYWIHGDNTYRYVPVMEIAEAFQSFHVGQAIRRELAVQFDNSKIHPAALKTSKYGVNMKELLKANIDREILLMKRNSFVYIFKALQLIMVAINAMTVFIRTNMHRDSIENGKIYMGAQFYGMIMIMFNGLAEMGLAIAKLPIFFKQRDLLFYPAWTYSLPSWIIRTPISFLNTTVWVFLTYYVIGFDPNIERFFRQYLVLFAISEATSGLFRFIPALTRHPVIASTMGSYCILICMLSSGFILPRDNVKKWWIWGYWISPLMYGQNALAVNEFLGHSWNKVVPGLRETLGRLVLQSSGFSPRAKWFWINVEDDNNSEANSIHATGNFSPDKKGMILPFVPLSITFEDIRYSVDMPEALKAQGMAEPRLELLNNINGSFRPGVLTALMGVSGAGKTTLLDVLAGRKTNGYIEGNITISGYPKKQRTFARVSGYCEQNDIHSPNVTIYESLLFSAWLRLPVEVDSATRKMFINEVMELVELLPLKDALVGLPGVSGLSTEQRKRLTIAVELVANPSIIFMDEPTSGLDARAAAIVMRVIRNTVDTGRTIVCTIHQPSIDIFESFDELFLMKRGGEEIYVGPIGQHSCELIKYFEAIEGVSNIKHGYNPSTWMMEVTSTLQEQVTGEEQNFDKGVKQTSRRFKRLIVPNSIFTTLSYTMFGLPLEATSIILEKSYVYCHEVLLYRCKCIVVWNNVLGYWPKKAQSTSLVQCHGFDNSSSVQPVVSIERTIFYRERASHMYSSLPYALGQVVIELPYIFLQTLIYGVLVYAMIGYEWTCAKFIWYMFFMYFTLSYYTFYGMMAVGLAPNYAMSTIVSTTFYTMWNLFSGFLIPRTRIPVWWRWYYWICPVAWTLNGLVTSQFGDVTDKFDNALLRRALSHSGIGMDDAGEIHAFGGSLRREGSSTWSSSRAGDVYFSRGSSSAAAARDVEDDEEALRWAALEKLPTYDRARTAVLAMPEGELREVNVQRLDPAERHALLQRLAWVGDDHARFLSKFKDRVDRVGIELPTIEVRYENLNVEAEAYVGSRGLPTILNTYANVLEGLANTLRITPNRKQKISVLHNCYLIAAMFRMTLLLGPPGAGKTSLLLALAGSVPSGLKVSGALTYNGHTMEEFEPRRSAAYVSQHDLHMGELTVRETINFSAKCQGIGHRYDLLMELSRREKEENIKPDPEIDIYLKAAATGEQKAEVVTNHILKVLGLDICADTIVGNNMLRGISGGQKKRVTTAEMIVTPGRALFMDEISTGLDSSTTYQIVNSIRQTIHIVGGTAVIALLQPAPETYELFDDIILLSDGQVVYNGPREHVLEFFESVGFRCPERKGIADFLQEVTSRKDQRQYWIHGDETYKYIPVKEFAEAFQSFHVGQAIKNELAIPFDKSRSHPAALKTSKYGASMKELLKANIDREILLMKRNSFVYIFKATQLTLMAFIAMTVFIRTNMHHDSITNGGIYMGALFFAILIIMFNGLAEVGLTIAKLPVFFKQRDLLFYPAWTYSIPSWIIKTPLSLLNVTIWVFITYYVIGFDPNVERLFRQFLLLLVMNETSSGLFRFIAGLARHQVVASTMGSFCILIFLLLGGFVMSRENVKKWWIWGYWISPLMYAQNAISVNEFLGHSWNKTIPGFREPLGKLVLESRGVFPEAKWYWIGVGALLGYVLLFNSLYTICLTFLDPFDSNQPTISEETLKIKQANLTGDVLEASSRGRVTTITNAADESNDEATSNHATVNSSPGKKGMVLPFVPLSITFEDIRYSVDMPEVIKAQGVTESRLELLKGISGSFRPGVLTALMGVSGAGKTTLMDVLAGRKTSGYIEGTITISGYPKKQQTFARVSGYCEQNDIHSPNVTVYESLAFSAWLRLPAEVDSATRKMFIDEVMELVELFPLKDALVGLPGVSGLSTEQRKRLTIAVELVANPSIIFMDEPTSGLDARAAAIVMRAIRNTVDTGRTVVCTIHQPSIDIFESFDELFLMKRGGEEIYVGPLGRHSCELIRYFESIEGVSKIKHGYNPSTWMLEVTSTAQEQITGVNFSEVYKNSDLYMRNKSMIKELSSPPEGSSDLSFPTEYSQTFITQCLACLWKQNMSYWRNPPYTAVKYFYTIVIALLFGTMFWGVGRKRNNQQDLFNAMGSMYASVLFMGVQNSSSVQPVVSVERTVFYRERAAHMYSPLPYALGQVAIELPYIFVQSLIYGVLVYAMIGFEWTAVKFFWYLFFMYFTLSYYTFYGMMSVGLTPSYNVASVVSTAFYAIWNLFSGFIIPRTRIPIWWRWYYWVCPVAWTLYGLVTSQFGDVTDTFDNGVRISDFVESYFGYHRDFLWVVAVVVASFSVLFAFLFGLSIKIFNFQKR